MKSTPRHFLDLKDFTPRQLQILLAKAGDLKAARKDGHLRSYLANKKLAMVFEKPSTRTRVSFEVGMQELGGYALFLGKNEIQLGHGETIADTARVLSRMVDAIMLRCHGHDTILELASHASVPVINGLTAYNHPCQLMADLLTLTERWGSLAGRKITWVGDGNNVANTWIVAAQRMGFVLELACPAELPPCEETLRWAQQHGGEVRLMTDAAKAVKDADAVVTDTWVSMGDADADTRKQLLAPYQVNAELMAKAKPNALFLHCLPAHRGEEVTNDVMDGPTSVVWDEAENRLHAQKAILLWCLGELNDDE